MRAYVRREGKRIALFDSLLGMEARQTKPAQPLTLSPGSEAFAMFVRAFGEAVEQLGKDGRRLAPLAHCQRLDVVRVQACGQEQPRAEAWCGQPHCADCARRQATEVVRHIRRHWLDTRVGVAHVPIGRPGGLELPSSGAVAGVRAAWGRVTKLAAELTGGERVEAVPRAILTPDGLVFFFRRPATDAGHEPELCEALKTACDKVGLRNVEVLATSRESAAMRAYRAVQEEARRFQENVLLDVERIVDFPRHDVVRRERALKSAARRWAGHVKHRLASSRRQTILGSKASLPLPTKPGKVTPDRACSTHGPGCRVESVEVRDHAREGAVVWRSQSNPFAGQPTKQALATFCAKVTDHSARLENVQTQILWRQAG